MIKSRSTTRGPSSYIRRQYNSLGGLLSTTNYGSFTDTTTFEYLDGRNNPKAYNPVTHYRYRMTCLLGNSITYRTVGGNYTIDTYNNGLGVANIAGPGGYPGPSSPSNGVGQFVLRGIQAIRPKFKADLSFPNFIYELKDLKHLVPDGRTISSYADTLSQFIRNPFKKGSKLAEGLSDATASQYLNAKFGYLPLIEDAAKLMESINLYNLRLDNFVKEAGKVKTGHYKEVVSSMTLSPVLTYQNSEYSAYQTMTIDDCTWILTLKYGYAVSLPKLYVPSRFVKYLGFRANPRILWDAIPFSFVLDWFLRFGKALESFDDGAIPVKLSIISAGISC